MKITAKGAKRITKKKPEVPVVKESVNLLERVYARIRKATAIGNTSIDFGKHLSSKDIRQLKKDGFKLKTNPHGHWIEW
jgi:hypothetical protein